MDAVRYQGPDWQTIALLYVSHITERGMTHSRTCYYNCLCSFLLFTLIELGFNRLAEESGTWHDDSSHIGFV